MAVNGMTHPKCFKSYCLDGQVSAWRYRGVVKSAIATLKYRFTSNIADELAENYIFRVIKYPIINKKNMLLVPIPLHKSRLRWRGFNQSELLGKLIANKLGWDFEPTLLKRIKNTQPQTTLKGESRKRNILGAFMVSGEVKKQPIVLFDDVSTTGSTLKEASKALKRKGAIKVYAMTLCG